MDELIARLKKVGLDDVQIENLKKEGMTSADDLKMFSADQIKTMCGCGLVTAGKVVAEFAPPPAPPPAIPVALPIDTEIPDGVAPSPALVNSFASQVGMDGGMLNMFLMTGMLGGGGGMGAEMDLSGLMPIPTIVQGYNPKRRDISYLIMGQLEKRLKTPIVVINDDGSVNLELTTRYIQELDEGFDPSEDAYDDGDGGLFQIVGVGVDAQSVYDADPLCLDKPLQKTGVGIGRVSWKGVSLEVRQVFRFALKTGEISPTSESDMDWVRDHVRADSKRFVVKGKAPKALIAWNDANRTGDLPMLRVMLTRGARKPTIMPARRRLGDDRPRVGRDRDRAGLGVDANGDEL